MSKLTIPTLKDLLEAGVHFGHQSRRWHPRMSTYIFTKRGGIHIFDLEKTQAGLQEAAEFLYEAAKNGGQIVFVCTKRQAKNLTEDAAKEAGVHYVTNRWLGGTITNFKSIKVSIDKYHEIKDGLLSGAYDNRTKKERLLLSRQRDKLARVVGGIATLEGAPDVIFVVDPKREKTAVYEARSKGIPVLALVDTNCNPEEVDMVIPGNDDAFRSVKIVLDTLVSAIQKGHVESGSKVKTEKSKAEAKASEGSTEEEAGSLKQEAVSAEEEVGSTKPQAGTPLATLDLSVRSVNALTRAGYDTVEKIRDLGEEAIAEIKGLGAKSIKEIMEKVKS